MISSLDHGFHVLSGEFTPLATGEIELGVHDEEEAPVGGKGVHDEEDALVGGKGVEEDEEPASLAMGKVTPVDGCSCP